MTSISGACVGAKKPFSWVVSRDVHARSGRALSSGITGRSTLEVPRGRDISSGRRTIWTPATKHLRVVTECSLSGAGKGVLGHSAFRDLEVPTNYYAVLQCSAAGKSSDIEANYRRVTTALRARAGRSDPDVTVWESEEAARALDLAEEAFSVLGNAERRSAYDSRFVAAASSATFDILAGSPFGVNMGQVTSIRESDRLVVRVDMDPAMAALSRLEHTLAEDRASGPSNSQRPRVPRVTREPILRRRIRRFTSQLFARTAS